jgi:hypothetical protein
MVLQYESNQLPRPFGLVLVEMLMSIGDERGDPRHNRTMIFGVFALVAMGGSIKKRTTSFT